MTIVKLKSTRDWTISVGGKNRQLVPAGHIATTTCEGVFVAELRDGSRIELGEGPYDVTSFKALATETAGWQERDALKASVGVTEKARILVKDGGIAMPYPGRKAV